MTWLHFFEAGAILLETWALKIAKKHSYEAVSSALNFPFFEGSLADSLRV